MCRPLYEVPADNEPNSAPTSSSATPTTIAPAVTPSSVAPTPSPAPGKVQKSGRRQSNLQAAPESIARALESMSNTENQKPENSIPEYFPPYSSNGQGFPAAYGSLGQQQPAMMHHQSVTSTTPQNDSCCSSKTNEARLSPEKPNNQDSCCAKKEPQLDESTSVKSELGENGNANFPDGLPLTSSFTAPSIPSWQNFLSAPNGDMFPPTFAVHQPQTPASVYIPPYTATHSTPNFTYPTISHNVGFAQPVLPVFPPHAQPQSFPYASPPCEGTPEHVCHCGDGCQCLGCASHPFNNTTKQHVQEMGIMVGINGEGQKQHSPYSTNPTSTQLDYPVSGIHQSLSAGVQTNTMNPYPGPAAHHFGNGYAPHGSYQPGQGLMEPSQYYTLEYPVGLPSSCSDVTGSCQCGKDCSCVGCLTHNSHNGFGLKPDSTESIDFHSGPSAQNVNQDVSKDFPAPSPSL